MTVIDWGASRAHQTPNTPLPAIAPALTAGINSEIPPLPRICTKSDIDEIDQAQAWVEPERQANFSPPPMSRTSLRVLHMLLRGDMSRLRSDLVADELGISPTTLRRRLRSDGTSYQILLDQARRHRCEEKLLHRWLPGKSLAWDLGYAEVNSFYRAFRRWTGQSYSSYKLSYI